MVQAWAQPAFGHPFGVFCILSVPILTHSLPPILSFLPAPLFSKLHLASLAPYYTPHCSLFGECLRALFQTQAVHPAVCNRWLYSRCQTPMGSMFYSCLQFGWWILPLPHGGHHSQPPGWPLPQQLPCSGEGETLRGGQTVFAFPYHSSKLPEGCRGWQPSN